MKMPALFVGHGNPMNAIEHNDFHRSWFELGRRLPRPKAVLCISAHWETRGVYVTAAEKPETIHDFYGFPRALFDVRYPAPGDPDLVRRLARDHQSLMEYDTLRPSARLAVPTPEHYFPLLYPLALQEAAEPASFFNERVLSAISMTSVLIGAPA